MVLSAQHSEDIFSAVSGWGPSRQLSAFLWRFCSPVKVSLSGQASRVTETSVHPHVQEKQPLCRDGFISAPFPTQLWCTVCYSVPEVLKGSLTHGGITGVVVCQCFQMTEGRRIQKRALHPEPGEIVAQDHRKRTHISSAFLNEKIVQIMETLFFGWLCVYS